MPNRKFALLVLIGFAVGSCRAEAGSPFGEATRRTIAGLLKIPLEPPEVTVAVRNSTKQEGVLVEDVEWASLDAEQVPAYVLRPAGATGRLPAIVCLHGSGGSREAATTPQFGPGEWTRAGATKPHKELLGWARELARRGYLTLALTQRGLDRRTPDTDARSKEMLLRGRNLMGAIVYEIRQAVSYLSRRPDVDPARIGMTGISFGGITTFYTWLADDRIAAAAPICGGVGSLEVFLERGARGYHGLYWWVPGMLLAGDHGHFAATMAPRPLMLWAPLNDIGMPKEGVERFLEQAAPAYERAGARENLVVHRPAGVHEFSMDAFDALSAFFDRHLRGSR
jgi:dienelactone hydrolase